MGDSLRRAHTEFMHSCGRGFIFQLPEANVIPLSKAFSALVNPDIIAAYELMIETIMCLKSIFKELNKAYANLNLSLKKVNVLDLGQGQTSLEKLTDMYTRN